MMPIRISEDQWTYRLIAIDNGTKHVGVVVLETDFRKDVTRVIDALPLTVEKSSYIRYRDDETRKLNSRINLIADWVKDNFDYYEPHAVAIESPFLDRRRLNVQSYLALTLSFNGIRDAVEETLGNIPFISVTPMEAKSAVSPKGLLKVFKDDIRDLILNDDNIVGANGIFLPDLNEHCIDAIAVGMAVLNHTRDHLNKMWRFLD